MISKRTLIAVPLLLIAACGPRGSAQREKVAPAVSVTKVARATVTRSVRLLGTVTGDQQAMVMSKIAGRVTEIVRPEGSRVAEGDPILYVQNDIPGMDYKPGPVTAPVAGVVGKIYVEVGSMASQAAPVAAVASFGSRVRVKAGISDAELGFARRGASAEVTSSALPGEVFRATVSQVSPMLDPMSRSATVELTVASPGRLVPGMTVNVRLVAEERADVPAIPLTALFSEGEPRVAVVEGGVARLRSVQPGLAGDELVEVAGGLAEGDLVITVGKERVTDGEKVNPVEEGTR
jgi:multidrug efflux pump subunit AcrA (membrane-fusion protein)